MIHILGRFIDLTGKTFGKLKVIKRIENVGKEVVWLCECQCNKKSELNVKSRYLIHGYKKSCGCTREKIEDLTGLKFNHWIVLDYVGKNKTRNSLWLCECDCENKTQKVVSDTNLKNSKSKCCGCQNPRSKTHGKSRSKNKLELKIYSTWSSMKDRCCNEKSPNYNHYGSRGIKVCDEWTDNENGFMKFYKWAIENGVRQSLTIDRIDVDGNYDPLNCRWVDYKVQNNNKTNSRLITYKDKTQTVTLWAEEFDIIPATLISRLNLGWDIKRSLFQEVDKSKSSKLRGEI